MTYQAKFQIIVLFWAASAVSGATITGVNAAGGSTPAVLPTAIVIDNGSGLTEPAIRVTKDSAQKSLFLDAGNVSLGNGRNLLNVNSDAGLTLNFSPSPGTTSVSRRAAFSNSGGTTLNLRGGTGNTFTQVQTDISYSESTGPTGVIEVNGQRGTVANNQQTTLPVLNTPATFLWSSTYTDPGAVTTPTDFPLLSFGGVGNKFTLYRAPQNRAGIASQSGAAVILDSSTGGISLMGTNAGISVNGTPILTPNSLRITMGGSMTVGQNSSAPFPAAAAIGYEAHASNTGAFAIGWSTTAAGEYSFAGGMLSYATGRYSHAIGDETYATGYVASSSGMWTVAEGSHSMAGGWGTYAKGESSFTHGSSTTARGMNSAALGESTDTWARGQLTVGRYSLTPATAAPPAVPSAATSDGNDPMFVVGGGSSDSDRKNALVVQANGNVRANGSITAAGAVINGGSSFSEAAVFRNGATFQGTVDIQSVPPKGGISMGGFTVSTP